MSKLFKVLIAVSLVLSIVSLGLSLRKQKAPPPENGYLEDRVASLEDWKEVAEPQLQKNTVDIKELQDSQLEDSIQINALNSDVAYLIEQLNLVKNKEINLHIDTTWIMGDSISIIGIKDSIHVRTKKQ